MSAGKTPDDTITKFIDGASGETTPTELADFKRLVSSSLQDGSSLKGPIEHAAYCCNVSGVMKILRELYNPADAGADREFRFVGMIVVPVLDMYWRNRDPGWATELEAWIAKAVPADVVEVVEDLYVHAAGETNFDKIKWLRAQNFPWNPVVIQECVKRGFRCNPDPNLSDVMAWFCAQDPVEGDVQPDDGEYMGSGDEWPDPE